MYKFVYLACLALELVSVIYANDVCHQPFSQFLKCASTEAQKQLKVFESEATPQVQQNINNCFTRSRCEPPNFSHANLYHLLPQEWAERISLVMNLMEKTEPRVQRCMVHYFAGIANRKIEKCIRQHGDMELSQFQMPELPEIQGLNFYKLKQSVLNRVVVMKKTMECSDRLEKDPDLQALIDCQKSARSDSSTSVCQVRDRCRMNTVDHDVMCKSRFEKVQAAACTCFMNEREKMSQNSGELKSWREMFNSLFKGGMARQYKQCCLQNGVPFPEEDVRKVDDALRAALRDVILHGLPERVQSVVNQLMQQVSEEGQKLFCDNNCGQTALFGAFASKKADAQFVRKLVIAERNPKPSLISGGLKGFLDRLRQG